jgi:uncharacterized protein YqjF (DUF2071 family)
VSTRAFLTARWRYLAMLNWRVDPALLAPLVPRGTVLDAWEGHTYLSVVGFLFLGTRLLGVPVPFHRDFEEVNLRFYVRRVSDGELRRAVVFIKELVPLPSIASVARLTYNEPYEARSMRHNIEPGVGGAFDVAPRIVEYAWREREGWGRLAVQPTGPLMELEPASEAEFITEHYWGYTRQRDGGTIEYEVKHPRWRVWSAESAVLDGDIDELYGPTFAEALRDPPTSAFLAEGSAVSVHLPRRIDVGEVRGR